jgi:sugar phosphate permease
VKITQKTNYIIDVALALSFAACFVTGLIKFPGLLRWLNVSMRQLPMGMITDIHDWSGVVMGVCVLAHLLVHARWIFYMTKKIFTRKKATHG